jgi:plasmid stabilization system protein ParE
VPRLRFSAAAKDDLASIAEYIADKSGSRAVAERFTRELRAKCRELAAAPIRMGRARPELRSDLRSHPHKAYVIFFRYVADVLEVVNILEGHRDIDAFFGGNEVDV